MKGYFDTKESLWDKEVKLFLLIQIDDHNMRSVSSLNNGTYGEISNLRVKVTERLFRLELAIAGVTQILWAKIQMILSFSSFKRSVYTLNS